MCSEIAPPLALVGFKNRRGESDPRDGDRRVWKLSTKRHSVRERRISRVGRPLGSRRLVGRCAFRLDAPMGFERT